MHGVVVICLCLSSLEACCVTEHVTSLQPLVRSGQVRSPSHFDLIVDPLSCSSFPRSSFFFYFLVFMFLFLFVFFLIFFLFFLLNSSCFLFLFLLLFDSPLRKLIMKKLIPVLFNSIQYYIMSKTT